MASSQPDGVPTDVFVAFVEEAESWLLSSNFFPSKIGGRPSWLALKHLPNNLKCEECEKPLTFLLQIYAPLTEKKDCFHRTIFVFFCSNGECYSSGKSATFKVFRSQLAKENLYYSAEPPDYDMSQKQFKAALKNGQLNHVTRQSSVCATCGCSGNLKCSNCKKVSYCCRDHQIIDWKNKHKQLCKKYQNEEEIWEPEFDFSKNQALLLEFALSEPQIEDQESSTDEDDDEEAEDDKPESGDVKSASDDNSKVGVKLDRQSDALPDKELEMYAKTETPETKQFESFKKKIASNPTQVLRYQRHGTPVWISTANQLSSPPACDRCGGPRSFEFQIMPQLLNHLNLDVKDGASPDWGCLYVFTCASSCSLDADSNTPCEYAPEYVWKQDVIE